MKLTDASKDKLRQSFEYWGIDEDFSDPIYNYLVHGLSPGSCFTAVLANDFVGAMSSSHPANTITAFKNLANWMLNELPPEAWGSYSEVKGWLNLTAEERKKILSTHGMIYTEREEVEIILKG